MGPVSRMIATFFGRIEVVMIKVKHFMDEVESDDGKRMWVEPIGLTRDLRQMCKVEYVLPHLGPPVELWIWFGDHPAGYEFFRSGYHNYLARSPYKPALQTLAQVTQNENLTLVHQGDDPSHNTAVALQEFISELQGQLAGE